MSLIHGFGVRVFVNGREQLFAYGCINPIEVLHICWVTICMTPSINMVGEVELVHMLPNTVCHKVCDVIFSGAVLVFGEFLEMGAKYFPKCFGTQIM